MYSGQIHHCLARTVNHVNTLQLQHGKYSTGAGVGSENVHREEDLRK